MKTLPLLLASTLLGTAAFAEEVRVYNWSDYIDEDAAQLPNAENLWGVIKDRTAQYDPGNAYSMRATVRQTLKTGLRWRITRQPRAR